VNLSPDGQKYVALATDYDGTLAHDGVVDEPTIASLRRARRAGLRLLMVTGRELSDLFATFAHSDLFEMIVAENGALLYAPATKTSRTLADPPPPALIERLNQLGVPLSVGRSIIATVEPHEVALLEAIRELGLEWHIIFNKGSVMALPSGVNKATGLKAALEVLAIDASRVVGVGDAENDLAFLSACGLSVAVANALPSVKSAANRVTSAARGAGVAELISWLIE
jgi:hypothetical protein